MVAQEHAPLRRSRARLGRFHGLDQRARVGGCECVEQVLVDLKIEHHMHAVAIGAEIFHVGLGQYVGFCKHDAVPLPPLQELAEKAEHVVLLLGLADFRSLGRDDERHRIHPEAGNAQLNPEPHDLENLRLHLRMRGVKVGLEVIETMEIPSLGLLVVAPSRLLHAWKYHAVIGARRLLLRPNVPIAVRRSRVFARLLEPPVLVRGVVDDEVDEHPYAALLRAVSEFDKIANRAVARINAVIIGHVVAVIAMGRDLERHQPDGRDAETMQVVETAHQTLEVADAVGVGIHVGSNRQAIDHCILVPKVIDHGTRPNGIEATGSKRVGSVFAPLRPLVRDHPNAPRYNDQSRYLAGVVSGIAAQSNAVAVAEATPKIKKPSQRSRPSNIKPVTAVLIEAAIAIRVPMNPRTRLKRPVPVVRSVITRIVSTVTAAALIPPRNCE